MYSLDYFFVLKYNLYKFNLRGYYGRRLLYYFYKNIVF
mgnify:CR=1 FL=1